MSTDYIWPLSNSTTPDEMNTSFGPRINNDKWDFHDGIDGPAPIGTPVHAMRAGTVHLAGPRDDRFSSRHVVLKVDDPNDGLIYLVYLHLNSIDLAVTPDASVAQGQIIGTVGDDDATYPHLHFEFRKGTLREIGSVHPLGHLPYTDTPNFFPPVSDRFNRLGSLMAARLLFGASSRLEGDLKRVEVDLKSGATLLECRFVDFDNKDTVNEGNSDTRIFKKDIGVEGYQKSPMNDPERLRNDLKYGVLVRNIPGDCDTLIARVIDVGNNIAASAEIAVPDQVAVDEFVDFEDGAMRPAGWTARTSLTGTGTRVTNDASAAHSGLRGMLCVDDSTTETSTQRAAIELALPAGRFEWIAEGWFNPIVLDLEPDNLEPDKSIQLLRFLSGQDLSVAARIIRREGGLLLAGIVA
ncbi:MAG: M23 family metallopeptidase, partial [Pyrinomonadaceae bacterium]